jgi:uncharacterized protein YoxC
METGLLVAVIVLLSVTLTVLVVGLLVYIGRLNRAVDEGAGALKSVRETVVPVAGDLRRLIEDTDELVRDTRKQVEAVGNVVGTAQRLVDGKPIMDAASRAAASSRSTLVSVLEGIREGLKSLRSARKEKEEESDNEQQ